MTGFVVCLLVAGNGSAKAANFPAGINLIPVGIGKQMTPAALRFLKTLGKHGLDLPSSPTKFAVGPQRVSARNRGSWKIGGGCKQFKVSCGGGAVPVLQGQVLGRVVGSGGVVV